MDSDWEENSWNWLPNQGRECIHTAVRVEVKVCSPLRNLAKRSLERGQAPSGLTRFPGQSDCWVIQQSGALPAPELGRTVWHTQFRCVQLRMWEGTCLSQAFAKSCSGGVAYSKCFASAPLVTATQAGRNAVDILLISQLRSTSH